MVTGMTCRPRARRRIQLLPLVALVAIDAEAPIAQIPDVTRPPDPEVGRSVQRGRVESTPAG
jgi:hypothetical protein